MEFGAMGRYLVVSAWRKNSSTDQLENFRLESDERGNGYTLKSSMISGAAAPVAPATNTAGWQRVEIYSKKDQEQPQFVLETVDWTDCTIKWTGSATDVKSISLDVKGRCLLGTDQGHRYFTLAVAIKAHAKASAFSEKPADAGEAILDAFGIQIGSATIIKETAPSGDRRTLSDIIETQRKLHLYFVTDLKSYAPCVLSALGIDDSDLVGSSDHLDLLKSKSWGAPLLKPGTSDLKDQYKSWVTHKYTVSGGADEGRRLCFGLRRVLRDDMDGSIARYALEMRMPVGVRRPVTARQLDMLLGPAPECPGGDFFVLYRLVQRQATDLTGQKFTGDGAAHWIFEIEGVSAASIWGPWNNRLLPERLKALRAVEGNIAISPLPTVQLERKSTDFHDDGMAHAFCPVVSRKLGWRVVADLVDRTGREKVPDLDDIASHVEIRLRAATPLRPVTSGDTSYFGEANRPAVVLRFPLFRSHDGQELAQDAKAVAHKWPDWLPVPAQTAAYPAYDPHDGEAVTPRMRDSAPLFHAEFKFPATRRNGEAICAVGAFDLSFAKQMDYSGTAQSLTLTAALVDDEDARSWPYSSPPAPASPGFVARPKRSLATAVDGTLSLLRLAPGAQDASAEAQAEGRVPQDGPILIKTGDADGIASDGLLLDIMETCPSPPWGDKILEPRGGWGPAPSGRAEVSRFLRLTVRLQDPSPDLTETFRVLSLETAPFLVASFEIEARQGPSAEPMFGEINVLAEARQQIGASLTWRFSRLGQMVMR
ncbi:MAG: hypothetical protein ABL908_11850, partial [Hyphomicrobium sp.]